MPDNLPPPEGQRTQAKTCEAAAAPATGAPLAEGVVAAGSTAEAPAAATIADAPATSAGPGPAARRRTIPASRLFAAKGRAIDRHLVIVQRPGWQDPRDWYRIAQQVMRIDPATAVVVTTTETVDEKVTALAAERPSLIFSPSPLGRFTPRRGKIYQGRVIPKLAQLQRLVAAGVRVPQTMVLRPGATLRREDWGEFVILKPLDVRVSSHGSGIQLMRTERVAYRAPADYPPDHPGRFSPMIVQQFIDTGDHITVYRVLTLFGQPLYCQLSHSGTPRAGLDAADAEIETTTIAIQGLTTRHRTFVYEADVVALAAAAHRAIPEVPLKGCDIIRDRRTGTLYVLELNPGGNTWHFSSEFLAPVREREGPEGQKVRTGQLDAFGTAAHVLAERTRAEAE